MTLYWVFYLWGSKRKMKKILMIIGICVLVAALPMATASPILKSHHLNNLFRQERSMLTNGSFSGMFAEKNETGYVPLGTFSGTFAGDDSGTFEGIWALDNGTASGSLSGWYWDHIFIGQMNTTGVEGSNWFFGLYRVNTTDNSFEAAAIIFGFDNYAIRYAMGTI